MPTVDSGGTIQGDSGGGGWEDALKKLSSPLSALGQQGKPPSVAMAPTQGQVVPTGGWGPIDNSRNTAAQQKWTGE